MGGLVDFVADTRIVELLFAERCSAARALFGAMPAMYCRGDADYCHQAPRCPLTGLRPSRRHPVAGDSYTFGNVTAGDTLTFFIIDYTTGHYWYSDPSLNPANENHVYSAYYAGGDPSVPSDVPAGIYIGFEDTGFTQGSDENYSDEQFVFANTSSPEVAAPEPASMLMLGSALIGLASARSRSRRTV